MTIPAEELERRDGEAGCAETAPIAALAPRVRRLRRHWVTQAQARGLFSDLSLPRLEQEAEIVFRVWCDYLSPSEGAGALDTVRWAAARSISLGRSIAETVEAYLLAREVIRFSLLRAQGAKRSPATLRALECLADRLVAQMAACCAEERERVTSDRLRVVAEAGARLAAAGSLDALLRRTAEAARELFGARSAALAVLGEGGGFRRFVTVGADAETQARLGGAHTGRDVLCVPVRADGRLFGNLYVTQKHDGQPFTDQDEALAATFAEQAGAAIRRATAVAAEHDRGERRQHRETLQRVIAAQEEERKRVARELHDHTGQSLTAFAMGLRAIESTRSLEEAHAAVREMRRHANEALQELHHLVFELRPNVLDELGLVAALERYVEDYAERTGIAVTAHLDALADTRLDPAVEIALYRIAQEALTNTAKHARARHAGIVLRPRDDHLVLIVEDDGRGFTPPESAEQNGRHFGLMGMQERVNLLGGKLTIESAPGAGTTIFVEVPGTIPAEE